MEYNVWLKFTELYFDNNKCNLNVNKGYLGQNFKDNLKSLSMSS